MQISVLTSNGYVKILPGFAYLFNKFYPDQKVTVVRYDVRPPKLPDNFNNYAIGNQADYTWSGGLRVYLDTLEDKHILLMLEDYYLDKPVDVEKIHNIHGMMLEDERIVKVDLTDDRLKVDYTDYHTNDFIVSDLNTPFLASVQAAIWRVDFLKAILNKNDNAWQFEKNKRTKTYLNKNKAVILGSHKPPMSYINAVGGEGNKPGEYDLKKIPQWMIEELKANNVWGT